MSFLSVQSDELRTLANELRQIKEHNTDWLHMEAVTLASSADAMCEAADAIESLQNKLRNSTLERMECECNDTIRWGWTGPMTYYEHGLSCGHLITSTSEEPPDFCEKRGARIRKAER